VADGERVDHGGRRGVGALSVKRGPRAAENGLHILDQSLFSVGRESPVQFAPVVVGHTGHIERALHAPLNFQRLHTGRDDLVE